LILRYHRAVHVAKPLCVSGSLVDDRGQEIEICGEIKDADGNLLTEAEGGFARTESMALPHQTTENIPGGEIRPEFVSMTHWPTWSACCKGPLERLCDLHIDWRLAPDRLALGGLLRFPSTLRQMPPAGVLAALFDQTLGLLGSLQGHGVMLTIRLQVTIYRAVPADEELTLLSRGSRLRNGPFKAQAWLWHNHSIMAEASGNFSVLSQGHAG
jgi:hypothetical protein